MGLICVTGLVNDREMADLNLAQICMEDYNMSYGTCSALCLQ